MTVLLCSKSLHDCLIVFQTAKGAGGTLNFLMTFLGALTWRRGVCSESSSLSDDPPDSLCSLEEGRDGTVVRGTERELCIDYLLVRIHYIIVVIRWTGLAPWEFEFPFPGSLTSTFLVSEVHVEL